jgi:hypothetical protein
MRKLVISVLLAFLVFGVTAQAAPVIYPIGQADTSGFSNGGQVGPTSRGWDFVVSQPITVVELGVNAGANIPITMTLWDVTTQSMLAQTQVISNYFTWEFASLNTPVTINPGDTYSVIGWADTSALGYAWYIFSNVPPAAFNPTGTVTYLNTRFDNSVGPNSFPTATLGYPDQYGVTDIGYTVGTQTPEPGTMALIGTAVGLVGIVRRKFNL